MGPQYNGPDNQTIAKQLPAGDIYMTTYTGLQFHHFDPREDDIDIRDIARALSNNCRYNGQCPFHYSNALHSLYVLQVYDRLNPDAPKAYRRTALMHDAAEAYAPDMHSLVKHKLPDYLTMLRNIEDVIAKKFDLVWPEPKCVKKADSIMLSTELVTLMHAHKHIEEPIPGFVIHKVHPDSVYDMFMAKWEQVKP